MTAALLLQAAASEIVTPRNGGFYHAAYAAAAGIYALYSLGLWRRLRGARRAAAGRPDER